MGSCAGASIAIDDCYEVWESGFISIPYDFRLKDLKPKLRRLLGTSAPGSTALESTLPSQAARVSAEEQEKTPASMDASGNPHRSTAEQRQQSEVGTSSIWQEQHNREPHSAALTGQEADSWSLHPAVAPTAARAGRRPGQGVLHAANQRRQGSNTWTNRVRMQQELHRRLRFGVGTVASTPPTRQLSAMRRLSAC